MRGVILKSSKTLEAIIVGVIFMASLFNVGILIFSIEKDTYIINNINNINNQLSELNITNYDLLFNITQSLQILERSNMCNGLIKEDLFLNGFYRQNEYYCVWTKNRQELDINRTECHEQCHHFVYNDWQHFCNSSTNKQ